jgi:hypothetical protein
LRLFPEEVYSRTTWAGAVVGVALLSFLSVVDSHSMNFIEALNRGLVLEEGLPL